MKKIVLIAAFVSTSIIGVHASNVKPNVTQGIFAPTDTLVKTPSQQTQTWFVDGHKEIITYYTDGSHESKSEPCAIPTKGSPKHYEWVWRNNSWVQTVAQNY